MRPRSLVRQLHLEVVSRHLHAVAYLPVRIAVILGLHFLLSERVRIARLIKARSSETRSHERILDRHKRLNIDGVLKTRRRQEVSLRRVTILAGSSVNHELMLAGLLSLSVKVLLVALKFLLNLKGFLSLLFLGLRSVVSGKLRIKVRIDKLASALIWHKVERLALRGHSDVQMLLFAFAGALVQPS